MPLRTEDHATVSWKIDVHSQGIEVTEGLTEFVGERLLASFSGMESRVHRVHLRLFRSRGRAAACTCYVRVDLLPSGGVARGDSQADARQAVALATARVGAAVRELLRGGLR